MKNKNRFWINLFLLIVIWTGELIFLTGCKKDEILFTPAGTVTDIDGNVYDAILIGTQTWMAENLNVIHYCNDDSIPNVTNDTVWGELTKGAYCDYNNNPSNSEIYGRLYNWYAVNTGNLCPTGWHVPTKEEWTTLTDFLGQTNVAGVKMKEAGTAHWMPPNNATNESGFTAVPGGVRPWYYEGIRYLTRWWSISEYNVSYSYFLQVDYSREATCLYYERKGYGYSVRCLKN
jgi:uncharacterized protein (TIGR02145 family)